MQLFNNCVEQVKPIRQIYPHDTLPLLHRYIAKVHPSPQTNKPSLAIPSDVFRQVVWLFWHTIYLGFEIYKPF